MGLFLYLHAVKRMKQRGITRSEVEEALRDPNRVTHPSDELPGHRTVVLGETAAGRRLKVIVEADDHEAIITVAGRDE